MPEIIETTVFHLDELSDAAKETARAWYRNGAFDDDWFEFVHEDFERICKILGVRLDTRAVGLYCGGTRRKPCIWFSGFWSQGDGACFEGVTAMPRRHPVKSASMRRCMRSSTASPTRFRRSSAGTSISSTPS